MSSTWRSVSSRTGAFLLRTRETVATETPARAATSWIVTAEARWRRRRRRGLGVCAAIDVTGYILRYATAQFASMSTGQAHHFPAGFLWGAATAAYQIEGSPLADGAGASIWHRFSHTPGRTTNGDTGDIACDHYHRYADDVALMHNLGLNAYRFSISWSRILPDGTGHVNDRGLGFYDRLVDALLAAGIQPAVTLYHWDLPAALDDRGGWLNPDVASWFADYARTAFRA